MCSRTWKSLNTSFGIVVRDYRMSARISGRIFKFKIMKQLSSTYTKDIS